MVSRALLVVLAVMSSSGPVVAGEHPADRAGEGAVRLPEPRREGGAGIEAVLLARRSVRSFTTEALSLADLGQILWAAQGVTHPEGWRTAPSAGALYPLELYVVIGRVGDLVPGVYRYLPREHAVIRVAEGDRRRELAAASLHQDWIASAPAVLVITGVYARTTAKYGERGRRYVHIEAGHAAENAALQAVALRLGTTMVGAFDDDRVAGCIHARAGEAPLLMVPVGRPG